jgi:hypothetical protein
MRTISDYRKRPLNIGQLTKLRVAMRASGKKLVWMVNHLLCTDLEDESELLVEHWREIYREVYPRWSSGDLETRDQAYCLLLEGLADAWHGEQGLNP